MLDVCANAHRPTNVDLPAAALPEQELDQTFDIEAVGSRLRMIFRQNTRLEARDFAVAALKGQNQRDAPPAPATSC